MTPKTPHALFTQVDTASGGPSPTYAAAIETETTRLLKELLAAQDRQNEIMEELVTQLAGAQKQRASELGQWKQANPRSARNCRSAAEVLGKVQMQFLQNLTAEVNSNAENLLDGEFVLTEFIDRFGPRLAHLNAVLQVLSQLGATPNPATTT